VHQLTGQGLTVVDRYMPRPITDVDKDTQDASWSPLHINQFKPEVLRGRFNNGPEICHLAQPINIFCKKKWAFLKPIFS
jgi:hypothetical protein